MCQLENLKVSKNSRKYNVLTLVLSLKAQLISSGYYRDLQSLECLSLPHPSTLRKLYSNIGLDTNFIEYLKVACQDFSKFKKHVLLQLDEIHVKSDYSYKGGKIFGSPFINPNSNHPEKISSESEPAKTVLAFQVSSLFTKWSEIVRLLPCCNPKSSELLPIVKQVIIDIEKCNLKVVAICADGYQLNVSLFKSLAGSSNLQITCPNPADSTRSIFLNIHSPGKDIRLRDPDSKVFELHDKRFHFFQSLFLGFRIGKRLVVLVELDNLVHTPLPA